MLHYHTLAECHELPIRATAKFRMRSVLTPALKKLLNYLSIGGEPATESDLLDVDRMAKTTQSVVEAFYFRPSMIANEVKLTAFSGLANVIEDDLEVLVTAWGWTSLEVFYRDVIDLKLYSYPTFTLSQALNKLAKLASTLFPGELETHNLTRYVAYSVKADLSESLVDAMPLLQHNTYGAPGHRIMIGTLDEIDEVAKQSLKNSGGYSAYRAAIVGLASFLIESPIVDVAIVDPLRSSSESHSIVGSIDTTSYDENYTGAYPANASNTMTWFNQAQLAQEISDELSFGWRHANNMLPISEDGWYNGFYLYTDDAATPFETTVMKTTNGQIDRYSSSRVDVTPAPFWCNDQQLVKGRFGTDQRNPVHPSFVSLKLSETETARMFAPVEAARNGVITVQLSINTLTCRQATIKDLITSQYYGDDPFQDVDYTLSMTSEHLNCESYDDQGNCNRYLYVPSKNYTFHGEITTGGVSFHSVSEGARRMSWMMCSANIVRRANINVSCAVTRTNLSLQRKIIALYDPTTRQRLIDASPAVSSSALRITEIPSNDALPLEPEPMLSSLIEAVYPTLTEGNPWSLKQGFGKVLQAHSGIASLIDGLFGVEPEAVEKATVPVALAPVPPHFLHSLPRPIASGVQLTPLEDAAGYSYYLDPALPISNALPSNYGATWYTAHRLAMLNALPDTYQYATMVTFDHVPLPAHPFNYPWISLDGSFAWDSCVRLTRYYSDQWQLIIAGQEAGFMPNDLWRSTNAMLVFTAESSIVVQLGNNLGGSFSPARTFSADIPADMKLTPMFCPWFGGHVSNTDYIDPSTLACFDCTAQLLVYLYDTPDASGRIFAGDMDSGVVFSPDTPDDAIVYKSITWGHVRKGLLTLIDDPNTPAEVQDDIIKLKELGVTHLTDVQFLTAISSISTTITEGISAENIINSLRQTLLSDFPDITNSDIATFIASDSAFTTAQALDPESALTRERLTALCDKYLPAIQAGFASGEPAWQCVISSDAVLLSSVKTDIDPISLSADDVELTPSDYVAANAVQSSACFSGFDDSVKALASFGQKAASVIGFPILTVGSLLGMAVYSAVFAVATAFRLYVSQFADLASNLIGDGSSFKYNNAADVVGLAYPIAQLSLSASAILPFAENTIFAGSSVSPYGTDPYTQHALFFQTNERIVVSDSADVGAFMLTYNTPVSAASIVVVNVYAIPPAYMAGNPDALGVDNDQTTAQWVARSAISFIRFMSRFYSHFNPAAALSDLDALETSILSNINRAFDPDRVKDFKTVIQGTRLLSGTAIGASAAVSTASAFGAYGAKSTAIAALVGGVCGFAGGVSENVRNRDADSLTAINACMDGQSFYDFATSCLGSRNPDGTYNGFQVATDQGRPVLVYDAVAALYCVLATVGLVPDYNATLLLSFLPTGYRDTSEWLGKHVEVLKLQTAPHMAIEIQTTGRNIARFAIQLMTCAALAVATVAAPIVLRRKARMRRVQRALSAGTQASEKDKRILAENQKLARKLSIRKNKSLKLPTNSTGKTVDSDSQSVIRESIAPAVGEPLSS